MGVGGRVAVDELGAGDDDDVDGAGEGGGVDVLVVLVGGTDGADGPAEVVHEGEGLWQGPSLPNRLRPVRPLQTRRAPIPATSSRRYHSTAHVKIIPTPQSVIKRGRKTVSTN